MNDSGKPIRKALQLFRAVPADFLIVHDDLERAVGKVSVKSGGGAAGHNGVRSIAQCLSTESFPRVRVGIGRPADRSQVASYVLESFTSEESELLQTVCVHFVIISAVLLSSHV
jgi:PTH1 family peptidyl-tRNA hydrolase